MSVDVEGGTAELTVTDDGPGIPEQERRILDGGRETALDHGSGLGLWLAQWVVDAADGSLEFGADGGTTVRVTIPQAVPGE